MSGRAPAQGQGSAGPEHTAYGLGAGPAAPPAAPRRRRHTASFVVAALCLALGAGLVGGLVGSAVTHSADEQDAADNGQLDISQIAERALPSVVTIQIAGADGNRIGEGSGFVIRQDGYIVTNNHVADAGGPVRR